MSLQHGELWSIAILALASLQICHTLSGESRYYYYDNTRHHTGSFYGDSYLRLPLEDASSESDIKLQFRTHRSNGLLMLAAGSPDYAVIELKAGMVRVRIDLGSGEASLSSPPGVRFDDWQWHYIQLMRSQEQLQLTIDGLYTTTTTTPGRFFELNINRAVFLGGVGSFVDVFFGNFQDYRGCLRDVLFNSIDIFHGAQQQGDPLNVYGIEWECSHEFGATSVQPISFLTNTSFLALAPLQARKDGSINFDLRTRTSTALLFYNAGNLESSDFIAVELVRGKIQLTVNKGSGEASLTHETSVNDGTWHQVEVILELTFIRVTVDRERREARTNFGENRFLDLHAYLFVGGVSLQHRAQAIHRELVSLQGLNAPAGSLQGCMQNLKVNTKVVGFREAQVSRGLKPECVWMYPCLSSPCIHGATCIETGHYGYECLCSRQKCMKIPGASGEPPKVPLHDILVVQDIVVREGGRVPITSSNIDIMFDYEAIGLRPSTIVFQVVNLPEHGDLRIDVKQRARRPVFTMFDINNGKVAYLHDGSEGSLDSIGMELEFLGVDDTMPAKLQQKYGFTLVIKVAPWNDKPDIRLPEGEALVLVENTQVKITPRILHVNDKDDNPQDLEYIVKYPQAFDVGYFEISDSLGVRARITSFTQDDINESRIRYVHRGKLHTQIRLQVSDGKDTSDPKVLKVQSVPLRLDLVVNTGIVVAPGGTELITRNNLTFTTNAPNQDIDIRYDITETPYYGSVERQQYANNKWVAVSTFTQRHIDKSRVRYIHTQTQPLYAEEWFKFKVTAMKEETDEMTFNIDLLKASVQLVRNKELILSGVKEGSITKALLQANSSIEGQQVTDILYSVLTLPNHGHLSRFRSRNPESAKQPHKQRLTVGSNFTQDDLDGEGILYEIQKALYSRIDDEFLFRLHVPGDISQVYSYKIRYEPLKGDFNLTNNGLHVLEGESVVITGEELYIETSMYKDFRYTILTDPTHGDVQLIDPNTGIAKKQNGSTTFTNEDIKGRKVVYKHDNSESMEDSFSFIATPIIQETPDFFEQEITEFTGTFDIKITLKNDNAPLRVIERVFNVVANRERIVTSDDISYIDPDIDYDSSLLEYTLRGIPNGEVVWADNQTVSVKQFTQEDLEDGKLLFKHKGQNYGRTVLWVTDGQYFSTGLFEVRASDPFIRFLNNTGLSVQKGEMVPILWSNLSVETNLDAEDRDIKLVILDAPDHGKILKNDVEKHKFNLADVRNEQMFYQHDGSNNLQDMFTFSVRIEDMQIEGEMRIKILLESHQDPPQIVNNVVVIVDEHSQVTIRRDDLEVAHPETPDEEIHYTITALPQNGVLSLDNGAEGEELRMFTQEDINEGRLKYQHQDIGPRSDTFMFDVTNGIQSLQGLEFVFEIVPKVIPIEVKDFSLIEGESRLLSEDLVHVTTRHFQNENLVYVIIQEPESGWIESRSTPGVSVLQFTQSQLQQDYIYYVHNGNDTVIDSFTIMAKSDLSHKQSNPYTIMVTIIPTNDEPPRIATKRLLEVWIGSVTTISAEHLEAVDQDTGPEDLMYVIDNPSNGDVALVSKITQNIVNFTQALINANQVVFVHRGSDSGGFSFKVNDGLHFGKRQSFEIKAKPLVLTLEQNNMLEVYPGIEQPITVADLKVHTNDEQQTRPITFTLQSKLQHGQLVRRENGSMEEILTFTQEDLDNKVIAYKHTAPMGSWTQRDSFNFDVATAYARSLTFKTFNITVAYENINEENKDKLIQSSPIQVEEGGSITIERQNLDLSMLRRRLTESGLRNPEVHYVISVLPMHGVLNVNSENATKGTTFMQKDINKGRIEYMHDHSDSLWDAFQFNIEIEVSGAMSTGQNRRPSRMSNTFNITVNPVNDEPFKLRTQYPGIRLVQGFTANITKKELYTEDPDTPPEGIEYQIRNGPDNGVVVLASNPDEPIRKFTQKDINENQVIFIQDGSMESGAFYFHVSDGKFKPYFKVFNIHVSPLTLELKNVSALNVLQGHSSAFLSAKNIHVETNGHRDKIMYNVTHPPRYGQLYMHNHPVYQFSQRHVDAREISYIQTDISSASDSFEFILYDSQNMITGQKVNISVIARVKQNVVDAPSGGTVIFSTNELDASELAAITGNTPVYTISKGPKYGNLYKIVRQAKDNGRVKREAARKKKKQRGRQQGEMEEMEEEEKEVEATDFTHDDVVNKKVLYRALKSNATHDRTDSFTYTLTAENSQPATNTYYIRVKAIIPKASTASVDPEKPDKSSGHGSEDGSDTTEVMPTPPPIDPSRTEPTATGTEGYSMDRLIVIVLVSGISVVVVVVLILTRCFKRNRKRKEKLEKAKEDSRTPLAQPNVHIEPQKHHNMGGRHDDMESEDMRDGGGGGGVPVINITPDTPQLFDHRRSPPPRDRSRSRSPSTARSSHSLPRPRSTSMDRSRSGSPPPHRRQGPIPVATPVVPSTPPRSTKMAHGAQYQGLSESDLARAEVSRTVPTCKVTPLFDGEGETHTPGGTLKRDQVTFDWENVDPELLQHCRKTNPVLHENKYWV